MFTERKSKFTTTRAAARLKLLQRAASERFDSNGVPKNIDKLVLVPGPDGKYNKFQNSNKYSPLTLQYIKECLSNLIEDSDQCDIILDYIKENRQVTNKINIKYKIGRTIPTMDI